MTLTFGSLFAGIGGFDLGLERAGLRCAWQVEINPYASAVLAKHWPGVKRWDDVATFPPEPAGDWDCDVICGGFPCQDISRAGKRRGLQGERSGLWREMHRILCLVRPRFICVENVSALLERGMGDVLGDLAVGGYDVEWDCLPAYLFGADHPRPRTFIVGRRGSLPDADGERREQFDASAKPEPPQFAGRAALQARPRWQTTQPCVVRRDHGIPHRVDRIGGLGAAVVPAIGEYIGTVLLDMKKQRGGAA